MSKLTEEWSDILKEAVDRQEVGGVSLLFLKDGKLLAQGPFAQAANRQFLQNVFEMDVVGYMQASRRKWDEVS